MLQSDRLELIFDLTLRRSDMHCAPIYHVTTAINLQLLLLLVPVTLEDPMVVGEIVGVLLIWIQ